MPRLPVVSGRELIAFMESLGYVVTRQRGSHVRLRLVNERGVWVETVPDHREIARGTLSGILKCVAEATGRELNDVVRSLANQ